VNVQTILLTGAGGFIGRHLLTALKQEYPSARLAIVSSRNLEGCLNLGSWQALTSDKLLEAGIEKIDWVIHAGAFTPKSGAEANDMRRCADNILATRNLMESLVMPIDKFIYLSTIDVYLTTGQVITENSPLLPATLYGWSKLYSEKACECWCSERKITLQVLRLGHIYGSGEEQYKKLIPLTIQKIKAGQPPVITSSGKEMRSFLHVKDCVRAILKAAQLDHYVGPVNVVSGQAYSVLDVVQQIIKLTGFTKSPVILNEAAQTRDYVFDNTKMVKWLCTEQTALIEGLKEEIEWSTWQKANV
jgi:nucleoside-diphosphate-sugar epimerase